MAFDLSELMKDVSRPDTGREQISYLPYASLIPDPNNGYSMNGLEELARSIEVVGLQQPLRVKALSVTAASGGDSSPIGGAKGAERYGIISGHRRHAAIGLILQNDPAAFPEGVPCIVDRAGGSVAMRELQLLLANADNRKLTSADEAQQAERISDCLRKLEDEGYVFPGRHRDWVSKLSGLSRTKLARLHAIRERLDKPLLKLFDKGKINETVSYALSQQPVETQRRICDAWTVPGRKLENMGAAFVTEWAESVERLSKLKCKLNKGGLCINQERIMDKICDTSYDYKPCRAGTKCCAECHEYLRCRDRCPLLDEKAKAERAKQKEARKDELAAEKAQKEAAVRTVEQSWARYAQALSRAGMTDRHLRAWLGGTDKKTYNPFNMYMSDSQVEALLDYSATDTKPNTALPFFYSFHADDAEKLCRFADALDVSLDYLFLRSERPERTEEIIGDGGPMRASAPTDDKPTWFEGDPPRDGRYLCRVDMGLQNLHEQTCEYRNGEWICFGRPVKEVGSVVRWWPLPDK